MNDDPVFQAVLEDITHVRKWCSDNPASAVPSIAVDYLSKNAEVLAFFISAVYDGSDETRRASLQKEKPRELDYSVIEEGNRAIAESTLQEAIHQSGKMPLSQVEADDVVVLHRVLQYGQYIYGRKCPIDLESSPLSIK
jgi:hypothetical protein